MNDHYHYLVNEGYTGWNHNFRQTRLVKREVSNSGDGPKEQCLSFNCFVR
jgi:hypothetical protein